MVVPGGGELWTDLGGGEMRSIWWRAVLPLFHLLAVGVLAVQEFGWWRGLLIYMIVWLLMPYEREHSD